jgi:riboflavin synthase
MFTGIIQSVGNIETITPMGDDIALTIHTQTLNLSDVGIGDSIAVNGVCLTVVSLSNQSFTAHVSKASLDVTTGLNALGKVNLEKALTLADRLGGHLVTGHVDGIGTIESLLQVGDCWELIIKAPHALSKYIAKKGSICVNGISLTVNAINVDTFTINLIPHTMNHTNIQFLTVGSLVNLEIDLIARYVERMTEWSQ